VAFYFVRILFLQGCGSWLWEFPSYTRIFNELQYNLQVWQGFINVSESFSYKDSLFILGVFNEGLVVFNDKLVILERTEFDLSKINWFRGVILLNPIVLVSWGRFPLCHTPIRPIRLSGIRSQSWLWVAWPRDHEVHIKSLFSRTSKCYSSKQ
jgi:hypothetical protein